MKKRHAVLGFLAALSVITFIDRMAIAVTGTAIQKDLGLSDFEMSLLLGPAFAICFGLCGYPLGWMTDRFSRRRVIVLGDSCKSS